MAFISVQLKGFRNLQEQKIDLAYPEVFLLGQNGQGKTNLLEALYILAYGTSFRTKSDSEIYTHGMPFFSVSGEYRENEHIFHSIHIHSQSKKKEITKNGKRITDRKILINTIPCIIFCHDDIAFANGEMSYRRFFLDQTLSLHNTEYIDTMRRFTKILKMRNAILKEHRQDLLDTIDIQFAETGLQIIEQRAHLIDELNTFFTEHYRKISGIENIHLEYKSSWPYHSVEEILVYLKEHRLRDIELKTSLSGPQRDKVQYQHDKTPFIPHASTGQIRLISLILRSVQAQYYFEKTQRKPILLLDDVLLELDPKKRVRFTELLPVYEQLFCTFLPGEPFEHYKKQHTKIYHVENGGFYNG